MRTAVGLKDSLDGDRYMRDIPTQSYQGTADPIATAPRKTVRLYQS